MASHDHGASARHFCVGATRQMTPSPRETPRGSRTQRRVAGHGLCSTGRRVLGAGSLTGALGNPRQAWMPEKHLCAAPYLTKSQRWRKAALVASKRSRSPLPFFLPLTLPPLTLCPAPCPISRPLCSPPASSVSLPPVPLPRPARVSPSLCPPSRPSSLSVPLPCCLALLFFLHPPAPFPSISFPLHPSACSSPALFFSPLPAQLPPALSVPLPCSRSSPATPPPCPTALCRSVPLPSSSLLHRGSGTGAGAAPGRRPWGLRRGGAGPADGVPAGSDSREERPRACREKACTRACWEL